MENPLDLLKYKATLKPADNAVVEQFKDMLPSFLINDWQQRGFSSYMNGLLMTTDPNDYYDVIADWVEEPAKCHVIMRTAFGQFFYFKDNIYYDRGPIHNTASSLLTNWKFVVKFSMMDKLYQEDVLQKKIYDKAVKRIGVPAYDEVYAFIPAIALGGDYSPDSIERVKLKEHLAFLAQLK